MRIYKVASAGVPTSMERILAASPRHAAVEFFRSHRQRNTILVASNIFSERVFRPTDFADEFPQLRIDELPLALPVKEPYDPARDSFVVAARAFFIAAALVLGGLAARFLIRDRDIPAGVVLSISAAMSFACGVVPSSLTLRRWLARDPQSLDAR